VSLRPRVTAWTDTIPRTARPLADHGRFLFCASSSSYFALGGQSPLRCEPQR
jgi:hypothetical protein